jgi:photosystem II stability/assembly factor-like uncharacterized protein
MKNINGSFFLLAIGLIAFSATESGCSVFSGQIHLNKWINVPGGRPDPTFDTQLIIAWAGGKSGAIFKTYNGIDWSPQNSGTTNDLNEACSLPLSTTDTTLWVVGNSGTILRTNDGGANWFPQNSGTIRNLNSVCSVCCVPPTSTDTILWAVGDLGTILKTTNGGVDWFAQDSRATENLNEVFCWDEDSAIVVGDFGIVRRTTDGGVNWDSVSIYGGETKGGTNLNSVFFVNSSAGWIGAEFGVVLRSTNGGTEWSIQLSATPENLNSIYFISPDSGAAVGDNGAIIGSTDGGHNWFTDTSLANITTGNLYDVFAIPSEETGWVVGDSGIIRISTTPVSIEPSNQYLPETYSLSQNYPNPFNPSTTIEFSLPQTSHVTLRVYNMVGEEVATLVSGELPVGTHATQWNATDVASGIYFYRLHAGDFIDTKKLLLLK